MRERLLWLKSWYVWAKWTVQAWLLCGKEAKAGKPANGNRFRKWSEVKARRYGSKSDWDRLKADQDKIREDWERVFGKD